MFANISVTNSMSCSLESWAEENLISSIVPNWAQNLMTEKDDPFLNFIEKLNLNQIFSNPSLSESSTNLTELLEPSIRNSISQLPFLYLCKKLKAKLIEAGVVDVADCKRIDNTHPLVANYRQHLQLQGREKHTIDSQVSIANLFLSWTGNLVKFQGIPIHEINLWKLDQVDVKHYLQYLRRRMNSGEISQTTASKYSGITLSFLRHLSCDKGLPDMVGSLQKIGQGDPIDWWIPNIDDVNYFFTAINNFSPAVEEHLILFGLMYILGLRPGEVQDLTWDCIDLYDKTIQFRAKGGHTHRMALTNILTELISNWKGSRVMSGFLFHKSERKLSSEELHRIYRTFATIVGWTSNSYVKVFRHAFCTHLLQQGVDLPVVSRLARHSNLKITTRYIHVPRIEIRNAANIIQSSLVIDTKGVFNRGN